MRLLNVHSRLLEEYIGDEIPSYAILSHTWGNDEVVFQDLANPYHRSKQSYRKIEGCCQQAIKDGYQYVWIDTCCIDKSSSAELSEAINSMYVWYEKSEVCYIYLVDVSPGDNCDQPKSDFGRSRWFTRGWTLQELLAPRYHLFFNRDWAAIYYLREGGDEHSVTSLCPQVDAVLLQDITGIPRDAFSQYPRMKNYCAAAMLAWAANRNTTRVEDSAYSLLGLLDINLPLLYGEGSKAFRRLQEEILRSRHDESILAAGYNCLGDTNPLDRPVLATSISTFRHCGNFQVSESGDPNVHSTMTNIGLLIELPLLEISQGLKLAALRFSPSHFDGLLVVPLVPILFGARNHFSRAPGSVPFFLSSVRFKTTKKGATNVVFVIRKHTRLQVYLQDLPTKPFKPLPDSLMFPPDRLVRIDYGRIFQEKYPLVSFYPYQGCHTNRLEDLLLVGMRHARIVLVFSGDISFVATIHVPRVGPWHRPVTAIIRRINLREPSYLAHALELVLDESPLLGYGERLPKHARDEIEIHQPPDEEPVDTIQVRQRICVNIVPVHNLAIHVFNVNFWVK